MRRLLTAILISLIALPWGLPVAAATPVDCSKATSNIEMTFCAEIDLKRADAELNVVWRQALGTIDKATEMEPPMRAKWSAALRTAQRAWIAFRDADCGEPIGYEWNGGSGMGLATLTCQVARTTARTADLRERYGRR